MISVTRRLEFDAGHRIPDHAAANAATCTATAMCWKSP